MLEYIFRHVHVIGEDLRAHPDAGHVVLLSAVGGLDLKEHDVSVAVTEPAEANLLPEDRSLKESKT